MPITTKVVSLNPAHGNVYKGRSRDSVDLGGLSYGAIFSIIDGTKCSPKAVLVCKSVNLVFISFSVLSRKGTVIDFLE